MYLFPFDFYFYFYFHLLLYYYICRFASFPPSSSSPFCNRTNEEKTNCDSVSKMKASSTMKCINSLTQKHNAPHAIAWKPNLIRVNTHSHWMCVCMRESERERERAMERRNSERKISARKCYGFKNWMFNLDVGLLCMYNWVSTSSSSSSAPCPLNDSYFASSSDSSFWIRSRRVVVLLFFLLFCFASPNHTHIASESVKQTVEMKWNELK